MQPLAGYKLLISLMTGAGIVACYYCFCILISVVAQKVFHYDKPQSILYKIVHFPINLPGAAFDLIVPRSIKSAHFNRKEGYLKKEAMCFLLNAILYSLAAYVLIAKA